MIRYSNIPVVAVLFLMSITCLAQKQGKGIYHKEGIDLNKNGKKDVYESPTANIDDRIEDLLSRMTIAEKTAQMVTLYGYNRVLRDPLLTPQWKNEIWKDGLGAIDEHINGFNGWRKPPDTSEYAWQASKHAFALNTAQKWFVEDTRLGIPVDFTNEGIRGIESYKATNFTSQLGMGQTWNRSLIREMGRITGKEARILGHTNVYAPILDVGRDQRWGRMERVYGESPFLVAELGIEMVKGMQENHQVAATSKHCAIYGANKGGREGLSRVDPQISIRESENVHLYPLRRVIQEAGLLGVMSSYNDYDGIPVQSSKYYLTEKLRNEYRFRGYLVSDSDAVVYLYNKHHTAKDYKEAVHQSVEAGLNVRCTFNAPKNLVKPLRELVAEDGISETVIDDRVRDILRVKFLVGLFDDPYIDNIKKADTVVNSEIHQKVALRASRESLVLLKNDDNLLPLNTNTIKKIAGIGPNANTGDYALTHYGPVAVDVTSVLDGVKRKTLGKNIEVAFTKGCDLIDENWPDSELVPDPLNKTEIDEIEKAVALTMSSDVAVLVVGGSRRTCGENNSRSSLNLPGRQLDLLKAVHKTAVPIAVVVISGRPLIINWTNRNVPAILQAFYPGSQGGTAIADVLFGDYNPGGKLTVTFPKTIGQLPFNFPTKPNAQKDAGGKTGPKGKRSRVNGSLYPFGYGLSYTSFEYKNLVIEPALITPNQKTQISFEVTNTGNREGDEVVQICTNDLVSSVTTYEKNLRGFERMKPKAGESKKITFTILPDHIGQRFET